MKTIIFTIKNSPLIKNWFTLHVKFIFDTLIGKNRFTFHGKKVKHISVYPQLSPSERKKVLFPTSFYLDRALAWQVTIAKALQVRGHDPIFMPLNIHFPRRNALYYDVYDSPFTTHSHNLYTKHLIDNFHLPSKPYSLFSTAEHFFKYREQVKLFDFQQCKNFIYKDIPLGNIALNPLIHFFRISKETLDKNVLEGYKDYLAIGMILHDAISKALDNIKPDILFILNGSFLDSHLQLLLARQRNIRVVTFEAGFMLNSLMLGVNESIIDFPLSKYLPNSYQTYQLTTEQNKTLDQYLYKRSLGKDCIFDYWGNPIVDHDGVRKQLGISQDCVPDVLFTNLSWDSAMLDCDIAFENQLEWIIETIDFYEKHPDRTLLIRIHPAEIHPPHLESRDKIADMIIKRLKILPKNVIIIPPNSIISSYPLAEISNFSLVYASTVGLESAIFGKTVLLAGKTHYRSQGFTIDIQSRGQYFDALDKQVSFPDKEVVRQLARKYAYFFFFGFMIPFPLVREMPTNHKGEAVSFTFTDEGQLLQGKDENLDFILDVLLDRNGYTERLLKFMS